MTEEHDNPSSALDRAVRQWKRIGLALLIVAAITLTFSIRHRAAQAAILRADPDQILVDANLRDAALASGKSVFDRYCASCHGADGRGNQDRGIPNLTDDDHLYGTGMVSEIEQIARYGIRAYNKRGWTLASMPAYASAVPYVSEPLPSQTPAQIEDLTQFLLSFTARSSDPAAALRGKDQYIAAGCWDCHGHSGEGDNAVGAPVLTDDVWLYGGSHDDIHRSIAKGRAGYSPAFAKKLSAVQLRTVSVYVASLAATKPSSREVP